MKTCIESIVYDILSFLPVMKKDSPRFSSNFEALASKLLENLEETLCAIHDDQVSMSQIFNHTTLMKLNALNYSSQLFNLKLMLDSALNLF